MKKIGLFYSTATAKTDIIAKKIQEAFGNDVEINIIPIEKAWKEDFEAYTNLILGTSTWFDGELPAYWDELIPELETLKMNNKFVAIFGLGDQVKYPDNFVDGVGILANVFEKCGAKIVGLTSTNTYTFLQSKAIKDDDFQGLIIDFENQHDKTEQRVKDWVVQLKKEFK